MYLLLEDNSAVLGTEDGEALLFAAEGTAGPDPPTGLAYDVSASEATWGAVAEASSYKLYRSDGPFGDPALVGTYSGLVATGVTLADGAWNGLRVSSVSHGGVEGRLSDPVIAIARDRWS